MIATHKSETVNFGAKGQVVIPRRLRKEFIKSLRGSLKGTKSMEVFMAERKREREL
jgi:hypothetical protein